MLEDETDLGDMEETPAMFKSKQLGTYRTNEEIRNAEFDRRDAVDKSIRDGINDYFNGIQEIKDGLDEALAKNDENYQRSIVGNDYFNGIKGLKDGLDEALAKNDEDYQRTIAELTAPPDESAMARKMRFEGYTDKDQESLISTVNRMKAAQGMSGGAMPMPEFAGSFAGEDTFGGVAGGDIGDEGFDEGGFDEEDFPGGDAGGDDFAEEIPDDNNFGRTAKSNFGGVNSGDLFGGAFGKNPKNFGKNSGVFESPAEFGEDTDFGEVADFGYNAGQKSESGMGGVFKAPSVNLAESKRSQSPEPWDKSDATQTKSPYISMAQTSRDFLTLKNRDLSAVPKYTERDHTPKERMKTIQDQMDLDKQMEDIYTRIGLLSEGGTDDSGRAVAGLYPSTKKYAETVDELVGSGALIADGNKRETLYSDAENPDKNIDAYTNLRWSSRATPDIMDRFKQVEENMNKASEDLNAEYQKLSEKYKEKEQLDKDIYLGIPYAAKETVHTVLPDPKYVKPTLNTIDYMNPITLPIRLTHDKIGNTWDEIWGAPPKNIFTEDYWKEKIYDSPPLLYSLFDYDDFYKDPAGYGAEYAASYALTGGIGAAARAGGKAAPRVYHTVIDPLNNSELKKKSLKYIEELTEKLPKSPVGVQYSIVNLPGGTAKSVSLVRRVKNLDIVHPLVTTLDDRLQNTKELYFGDPKFKNPWVLLQDSTGNRA
ncbi:MAG: hypothetical protein IKS74_05565, partial [Methanomicrobium sp.]|nr:hypothetical protein [Methanomicrobium sp.]